MKFNSGKTGGSCICSNVICHVYFQVVYSNIWRVGSNVMMPNTLQQGSNHPGALGYTRTHSRQSYLLQNYILNLCKVEKDSVAELDTLGCPSPWFNGAPLIPPHF